MRRGGTAAVRPGPRPHRRHAGQAGGGTRVPHPAVQPRLPGAAPFGRRSDLRGGGGPGAGRPEAVRAARRDRYRRVDPADRQLHHEQEDRRGHRQPGPRREGRLGCVHEGRGIRPRAGPHDGRPRRGPRGTDGGAADRHVHAAGVRRGQRRRGGRVRGGTGRWRPARRRRADPRARPRDAGRRRAARRRPRGRSRRRPGDGLLARARRGAGRRPGRSAAARRRDRGREVYSGRLRVHSGRIPDRSGRLAARRRTGPQGGPGLRRRRRDPAPPAR